jgi:hypothetical protein
VIWGFYVNYNCVMSQQVVLKALPPGFLVGMSPLLVLLADRHSETGKRVAANVVELDH